jgi:hypothetical protein
VIRLGDPKRAAIAGQRAADLYSATIFARAFRTMQTTTPRFILLVKEYAIMIVNMSNNATPDEINHIIERIRECGFQAHVVEGAERTIIGAIGSNGDARRIEALRAAPGVAEVIPDLAPVQVSEPQLRQRAQ